MRLLITGTGLVGSAVTEAATRRGLDVCTVGRADCELSDRSGVLRALREWNPNAVVHTAALVDPQACEREPQLAYRDNVIATQNVALACADVGAELAYMSGNVVFEGSLPLPQRYREFDELKPAGVYAQTKRAGEVIVTTLMRHFYVVRTSWLFGIRDRGRRPFVDAILERLHAREPLELPDDQWTTPTSAADLAEAVCILLTTGAYGIYHLVSEGDPTTPQRLAATVAELTGLRAELRPATRGAAKAVTNRSLANVIAAKNLGIELPPWRDALHSYLADRPPPTRIATTIRGGE
jgi:dTDP-4-dehydrorhamnose reductase